MKESKREIQNFFTSRVKYQHYSILVDDNFSAIEQQLFLSSSDGPGNRLFSRLKKAVRFSYQETGGLLSFHEQKELPTGGISDFGFSLRGDSFTKEYHLGENSNLLVGETILSFEYEVDFLYREIHVFVKKD